jgi:hypothetical protein
MTDTGLSNAEPRTSERGACTRRRFLQAAALAATASSATSASRAEASDRGEPDDEKLFWGDLHTHTALSDGNGDPEDHFEIARSHLDFWAMADHAYDEAVFSLDYRKRGIGRQLLNDQWSHIQELCGAYEDPSRFVPFLGYEWTNFRYGHHNVYYLEYDQPIRMPPTLPELYAALNKIDALVIPHHPGYPVGICGKDWDFHDERLSPFVEIYSLHGSSETPAGIQPLLTPGSWMGPGGAEGYTLGIMASSDSHGDHPGAYDLGLIAAYAKELTRPSLWESFQKRRVYAVTGDRIKLDFSINGHPMGSTFRGSGKNLLTVSAVGWDKIERVEVVKNNGVLHTFAEPAGRLLSTGATRFRFFVEWGWDVRSEHEWQGVLTLTEGTILQAIPCFRGNVASRKGSGIAGLSDTQCRWTSNTEKARYDGLARRFADAMAFEVACPEDARLQFSLTCDQRKQDLQLSPAEILRKPTVRYMEDIPETTDGAYWHNMETCAKFKVHRGWLTDQLSLTLTCEDESPARPRNRADFYYVRLIQRNGGRAWSSPIWVEHGWVGRSVLELSHPTGRSDPPKRAAR